MKRSEHLNIPSHADDNASNASGFTSHVQGYGRQSSIASQKLGNKLGQHTPGGVSVGRIRSRGEKQVTKEEVENHQYKEQFVDHMKDMLTKPKNKTKKKDSKANHFETGTTVEETGKILQQTIKMALHG